MGKVEFTKEQQAAVYGVGNTIVSAGAGSGKTAVMIERITEKLKAGKSLENMLIVTFTRAAAADIKVKLVEKLKDLRKTHPAAAQAALEALPVSDIGTLHGFCQRLIKTYFYAAGVDPSAVVCEDGEAKIYKRAAVRAAVAEALCSGDVPLRTMYDALSMKKSDDAFIETIENIVDYALSTPDPDAYLSRRMSDADNLAELKRMFAEKHAALAEKLQRLAEWARELKAEKFVSACGVLYEVISCRQSADAVPKTSVSAKADVALIAFNEEYKQVKTDCKTFVEECDVARAASLVDSAPYSEALCALARAAIDKYANKKAALGKLDYSDLEHGARRVLSDAACRAALRQKIEYVFIDEFQDVNPLQASIADELEALGAEMFLVGDIKQSIYGFRRCSPEHFAQKLKAENYTSVALARNFRSSRAVVDLVNDVFAGLMTEDFGGVEYDDEKQKLIARADAPTGGAGLFYVDCQNAESEGETDGGVYSVMRADERAEINAEAVFVAERILEYMAEDKTRAYKNVAVLVRGMGTKFCADLKRLFEKYGIPARFGKNPSLKVCPEAVCLLDILRCTDNRYDDLALYTALRSSMGGFSDCELMEIARVGGAIAAKTSGGKRVSFWQKAEAYRGELEPRLRAFYAARSRIAEFAQTRDAAETLGKITADFAYFPYVYENFGADAAGNVQALINAAVGFDVHAFIKRCDDTGFELTSGSAGDAVSVMTVHASKGLEFDFCIVADTAHKFNLSDATDRVIVSERGVSVKIPDAETKTLKPSVPWLVENRKIPQKLKQEELRLLYVALTRAKNGLVVCGRDKLQKGMQSMLSFMRDRVPAERVTPKVREHTAQTEDMRSDEVEKAVAEKCNAHYGYRDAPVKRSVTSIAELSEHGEDESAFVPVMFDDEFDTAVQMPKSDTDERTLGTLYHKAMELLDFAAPDFSVLSGADGMDRLDRSTLMRAAETLEKVTRGATHVFKERYFIADLPIEEPFTDGDGSMAAESTDTLVQGVIDLLVLYADGSAAVVDYKTTKPKSLFTDAYKKQLELYARAVEKSTGYNVKNTYLYSFVNNALYDVKVK